MASKNKADKGLAKKYIFFVLKFLAVFLLLSWLFDLNPVSDLLISFFVLVMRVILFALGQGTVNIVNNELVVNSVSMIVAKECTGASMYALFIAFAAAYGISKKSWRYAIFGTLMLIGLNALRLATIIIAARFGIKVFNMVHDFLWPSTFFIFTLMTVLYYIRGGSK